MLALGKIRCSALKVSWKKIPPRKPCVRPAKIEEEVIPIVHDEPELDPAPYDPDSILEVG